MKNPWNVNDNDSHEKNHDNKDNNNIKKESIENLKKILLDNIQKNRNNQNNNSITNKYFALICPFLILCIWLFSGIYRVNSNENAIVSYFGKYYETTKEGIHFYIPYPIGKLNKINVKTLNKDYFTLVNYTNNKKTSNNENLILTNDNNLVNINIEIQWKITNAKEYVFNVVNSKQLFNNIVDNVITKTITNNNFYDILYNISNTELQLKNSIQDSLDYYKTGIKILNVKLSKIIFPDEFNEEYNKIQELKLSGENKIKDAEIEKFNTILKIKNEADFLIKNAELYKKSVILDAENDMIILNKFYEQYKNNKESIKKIISINAMENIIKNNKVNTLNK